MWARRIIVGVVTLAALVVVLVVVAVAGAAIADGNKTKNDKPRYGSSGLPANCRALVQANISGYRLKQYSADEVINSLDRNCGASGQLWGD